MQIDPRAWLKLPWPTLFLGLAAFGIAIAIVLLAFSGTRAAELLATPASAPKQLEFALTAARSGTDLAAIKSQALLHATRTYYVAPLPDATPAMPPLPDYRLAGAFIVPNKPAVALLSNRQGGATRRVRHGDELDGWRVETIEVRRVVLSWQEQKREITAGAAPVNAGLKRVPMQRQRVATNGVQSLGAAGVGTAVGNRAVSEYQAPVSNTPRLYRPPPSN